MPQIFFDYFVKGESPDKELIKTIRESLRMSVDEACQVTYIPKKTWMDYENGDLVMIPAIWELFCLKTGLVILTKARTQSRQRKITAEFLAKSGQNIE